MCKRKDLGELQPLPDIQQNPKQQLTKCIKDFIYEHESEENTKYIINGKLKDVEKIWNNFIKLLIVNKVSIPKFPIWTDWWDNEFEENDTLESNTKSLNKFNLLEFLRSINPPTLKHTSKSIVEALMLGITVKPFFNRTIPLTKSLSLITW